MAVFIGAVKKSSTPVSLQDFAISRGLRIEKIKYNFQGLKKFNGFALVDNDNNEIVEIEPENKGYSVVLHGSGLSRYRGKNILDIVNYLKKNQKYIYPHRTGFRFSK